MGWLVTAFVPADSSSFPTFKMPTITLWRTPNPSQVGATHFFRYLFHLIQISNTSFTQNKIFTTNIFILE